MTVTMTSLTSADAAAVRELDSFAFADDPDIESFERATASLDWTTTFGARHERTGDGLAGVYTWFDMDVAVPGPDAHHVPMAGLSWVGVHPDARRRGVLRTMMAHFFARAREAGYPMAGLTASEKAIYGRFGFGTATLDVTYTVGRGTPLPDASTALGRAADEVDVRLLLRIDDETTLRRFREIDATTATPHPGHLRFPENWDRRSLHEEHLQRIGEEPRRALVATRDGHDVGYAVFRRDKRQHGAGAVQVIGRVVHAHDDAALLALVRRLADIDLTSGVRLHRRGLDDAPIGWAGGPRDLDITLADGLWLRPLDVDTMLAARGYAGACDVVLDVLDPLCGWNEGRWRLSVGEDGRSACERTTDAADLRLGVGAIAPWYLGLRSPAAPALTGTAPEVGGIEELRSGALASFARATATAGQPLCGRAF